MNTPVSFELAKMLKEKGFTSVFTAFSNKYYNSLGEYKIVSYDVKIENNEYEAPTIVEVVMWLYKKHEIWITVGVDSLFYKGKHNVLIYKNIGYGLELSSIENKLHGPYNSPTEAYEAAIEYTLKNLIP